MKKTIILTAIISAFFLSACATSKETLSQEPEQIIAKTDGVFLMSEIDTKITFPKEYTITKNGEKNRNGSFASYDFSHKSSSPRFERIQLLNEESIKQYAENCTDSFCYSYAFDPDLERYNGQKNAFDAGNDYEEYELKKFGDRNYFVSNRASRSDGSAIIRNYTTFINDTKIDVWITMTDDTQTNAADMLFEEFEITE